MSKRMKVWRNLAKRYWLVSDPATGEIHSKPQTVLLTDVKFVVKPERGWAEGVLVDYTTFVRDEAKTRRVKFVLKDQRSRFEDENGDVTEARVVFMDENGRAWILEELP